MNPAKTKSLYQLLTFGSLCNNANIIQKKKAYVLDGDPTEGALVVSRMKAGITREALKGNLKLFVNSPLIQLEK